MFKRREEILFLVWEIKRGFKEKIKFKVDVEGQIEFGLMKIGRGKEDILGREKGMNKDLVWCLLQEILIKNKKFFKNS